MGGCPSKFNPSLPQYAAKKSEGIAWFLGKPKPLNLNLAFIFRFVPSVPKYNSFYHKNINFSKIVFYHLKRVFKVFRSCTRILTFIFSIYPKLPIYQNAFLKKTLLFVSIRDLYFVSSWIVNYKFLQNFFKCPASLKFGKHADLTK